MTIEFKIIPPFKAAEMAKTLDAATTLGIEVTVPAIAAKCGLGNIDHHGEGCTSKTYSACEQVFMMLFNWHYSLQGWGIEPKNGSLSQVSYNILDECSVVVGNILDADTLLSMSLCKICSEDTPHNKNLFHLVYMIGGDGSTRSSVSIRS